MNKERVFTHLSFGMRQLVFEKVSEFAVLPAIANPYDGAYDVFLPADGMNYLVYPYRETSLPTGWKVQVPLGYRLMLHEKSGLALNKSLHLGGGMIDYEYGKEVRVILRNQGTELIEFKGGDKICQMYLEKVEIIRPVWGKVKGDRNGFGSTGR